MQPLALQAALHVGEREHDGVDLAGVDALRAGPPWSGGGRCGAHVSPSASSSGVVVSQQAAQQRGRVVAVLLHDLARPLGPPARIALHERGVLAVGVGDVGTRAPGSRSSISCSVACTEVTASTIRGEPVSDGDREVEARVGLPVLAPACGPSATVGVRPLELARAARRRASRSPRGAAAPGSTIRRKSSASSQSAACAADDPGRGPGRRRARLERHDRAAAATARGLDQPGLAQGGDRLAQRRPGDSEPLGELALGGQRACPRG